MLTVDIWSDIVCPWCYIGKRRFEAALARFSHANDVEVTFHSFELDPRSAKVHAASHVEHLANKYRVTPAQAQQMIDRVTAAGADAGLELHLDKAHGGNTFDAHRLLHWAGLQNADAQSKLKHALLTAYHGRAENPGARDVLLRGAGEAGLDIERAAAILDSDEYAAEVRERERHWQQLGINSVPAVIIDDRHLISGGQPPEVFERALRELTAVA